MSKNMLSWAGRVCKAYEDGKKQGALEELNKALKFGKTSFNFVAQSYIENRIKELKVKTK